MKKFFIAVLGVFVLGTVFFYGTEKGKSIKRTVRLEMIGMGLVGSKNESDSTKEVAFDYSGSFTDISGNRVNLSDFKGKTLFINVWASWCPPCRVEMPYIHSLYNKVKSNPDVAFLMIAIDEDFEKSKKLIADKGYTFPVYHADEKLNPSLYTQAIPTTVIVNPNGNVTYYLNGTNNFDTEEFMDFLISQGER